MARVRLTKIGYTNFTGDIGKVAFVNGVSGAITDVHADAIGSVMSANIVADDGATVVRQAGGSARAIANKTTRVAAHPNRLASTTQAINPDPLPIKTITDATYTLTNGDAGYLLDFTGATGCLVTVPASLEDAFYCTMHQGGNGQIQVVPDSSASVVEIDNRFKSEKRLAILSLTRFPDRSFQLTGRTA
jgi:hypothetical protein